MKRHGWKWGAVLGVLGLVLWLASRGAPGAAAPGGPGSSQDSRAGAGPGPMLQALFSSAAPDAGDPALRIRGHVRGAEGAVAGARVLASAVVAEESLSALPCGTEDAVVSALHCYGAGRLAGLVTQRSGDAPVLARATSGEDGSFSLEGLKAGHYALWVESPEGASVRQDVAAGDEGVELLLGAGVRVSGSVVDEERAPVAGALVTAIFKAHSRFFETVTDGAGHYHLGPLPRGEYVLLASKAGLLPQKVEFTGYGRELERKFLLFRPRRISGQVVLEGAPVAGARVSTVSYDEGSELEVLTDAAGRFSLGGLNPLRHYVVIARHEGAEANTQVSFDTGQDPPRFVAEHTDITLELEPVAEVTGIVRDESGRPIQGASVELWEGKGEDAEYVAEALTDAEGRYRVGPAEPGPLRLELTAEDHVSPDGHEAVFRKGKSTLDFVLQRVPEEERVKEEEPEGPPESRPSVVGEVVDELGAPVPHAEVTLWGESSSGELHAFSPRTTDAKGHFSLEVSANHRYRVTAEFAQEDVTHTASRVVEVGEEDVRVRLRFEQGHVLSGVVVDSRGQPLEGASVALRSSARKPRFHHGMRVMDVGNSQETGPDGRFRFQSVSGEQLELYVWKMDYVLPCARQADGRTALAVKPGDRELRVVLARMAFVRGRFAEKDGTPITSFVVNDELGPSPDGRFSVPIRCTGTLQLELAAAGDADAPGSRRVRHSVAVREEEDLDVGTLFLDGK